MRPSWQSNHPTANQQQKPENSVQGRKVTEASWGSKSSTHENTCKAEKSPFKQTLTLI
jgi:hypothetical protein